MVKSEKEDALEFGLEGQETVFATTSALDGARRSMIFLFVLALGFPVR